MGSLFLWVICHCCWPEHKKEANISYGSMKIYQCNLPKTQLGTHLIPSLAVAHRSLPKLDLSLSAKIAFDTWYNSINTLSIDSCTEVVKKISPFILAGLRLWTFNHLKVLWDDIHWTRSNVCKILRYW